MYQYNLLQLLLWADVICMTTLLFSAISRSRVEAGVTLATDHFVAVILLSQYTQRWFDYTSSKTKYKMKSGFCQRIITCYNNLQLFQEFQNSSFN